MKAREIGFVSAAVAGIDRYSQEIRIDLVTDVGRRQLAVPCERRRVAAQKASEWVKG